MAKRNSREEIQNYFGYSDPVMAQWWDRDINEEDREFFETMVLEDSA